MTGDPLIPRLGRELAAVTALVLVAVLAILLAGQLLKIGDLLWAAGPNARWAAALGGGGLILLEAALPLAGLLAAGLVYGRLRAEDGWIARAALGGHPGAALAPAALIGLMLGALATALAHGPAPRAVTGLRATLLDAAAGALRISDRPLDLPGGAVALRSAEDGFWAALPASGGPMLIRAEDAALDAAPERLTLRLRDAHLWSPGARIRVAEARLTVPADALGRRLGMLGPPNALPTAALDPADAHHRFTEHRRWALPAMAPLWALLGALLGARLGGPIAVASGAGAVAVAYWLLRTGELSARAGFMSPALAAWAPAALLALGLLWAVRRDPSLARPTR